MNSPLPDLKTLYKEGTLCGVDLAELRLHVFRGKECQMFVNNFTPELGGKNLVCMIYIETIPEWIIKQYLMVSKNNTRRYLQTVLKDIFKQY